MYCTNCGKKLNKNGICSNCDKKISVSKNNSNDKIDKNTSNILGILTLITSFFLFILNIPLGIVSIVTGHNYKKMTNEKCYGPTLAIIGMIISIIMTILFIIFCFLFINVIKNDIDNTKINTRINNVYQYDYDNNYINGKWKLENSQDVYEFDMSNKKYNLYKENDKENNYCEGTFSIYNSYNDNNDYYKYSLIIKPVFCIINGEKKEQNIYETYSALIDKKTRNNLIITNNSNKYYNLKKD